jgi:hypothetical protein
MRLGRVSEDENALVDFPPAAAEGKLFSWQIP